MTAMKKLNKKQIISKFISGTITFLIATAFAVVFKLLFGENNTYIGISSFIAMLMYLERDLTTNFLRNSLTFILINLSMGLVVFIGSYNLWIAIPLNFILIFVVGYITCSELRRPVYIPFILQFIFLVGFPVPHKEEGLRLLALLFGAITIMIPQLLINRNRIKKNSMKIFLNLNSLIKEKVILLSKNQDTSIIDKQIKGIFRSLKFLIFDSREKKFYISKTGEASLSLLTALEKIDSALSSEKLLDFNLTSFTTSYFDNLNKLLKKESTVKEFVAFSENFIESNKESLNSHREGLQILNSLILINDSLLIAKADGFALKEDLIMLPSKIKFFKNFIADTKDSLGFSYGLRVAIGMTITCFITQYFNFPEGQWMMFTIFSIVNPIYETAKYKTKDRVFSTILGAIVTIVLLSIFKGSMERTLVLLIVGYIMCYTKQYKFNIFYATICIITMATGTGNVDNYALQRLVFVFIGLLVAIPLNKFILRCDLNKLNLRFKKKYEDTILEMIKEIYVMAKNQKIESTKIKNLFLSCALIDKTIRDNFEVALLPFEEQIELNNSILVTDLFSLFRELEKHINNPVYTDFLVKSMDNLNLLKTDSLDLEAFEKAIEDESSIEKKLTYSTIYEIFSKFKLLLDNKTKTNLAI